ncbi:hypothetical protein KSC_002000 [Ktedonobacter sp. SOSP1-52]|nr:hypothetical protein KSC_002000 [Ktedonobacter sp. SOSP1-52]
MTLEKRVPLSSSRPFSFMGLDWHVERVEEEFIGVARRGTKAMFLSNRPTSPKIAKYFAHYWVVLLFPF